jgi:outer membrane protein TolC
LTEKRLKSFLGIELDQTIDLVDNPDDTTLTTLPPRQMYIDTALAARPAVQQADLLTNITDRAIRVAKGDFLPSIDAVSSYNWFSQSDAFTLSDNTTKSFTAGIEVSIPIFRGGERFGNVSQRKAEHTQAQLAARQTRDDVRLQVEEAYDQLVQAKKALDVQDINISEAEEGLKIANVRYESGVGTLLEVLSAQVALTDARNAHAAALFSFRKARAQLKRASTIQPGTE